MMVAFKLRFCCTSVFQYLAKIGQQFFHLNPLTMFGGSNYIGESVLHVPTHNVLKFSSNLNYKYLFNMHAEVKVETDDYLQ